MPLHDTSNETLFQCRYHKSHLASRFYPFIHSLYFPFDFVSSFLFLLFPFTPVSSYLGCHTCTHKTLCCLPCYLVQLPWNYMVRIVCVELTSSTGFHSDVAFSTWSHIRFFCLYPNCVGYLIILCFSIRYSIRITIFHIFGSFEVDILTGKFHTTENSMAMGKGWIQNAVVPPCASMVETFISELLYSALFRSGSLSHASTIFFCRLWLNMHTHCVHDFYLFNTHIEYCQVEKFH